MRPGKSHRLARLAGAGATGIVLALVAPPIANAAALPGFQAVTVSFSGHCQFGGAPALLGPRIDPAAQYTFAGPGTCVGSLDGAPATSHAITGSIFGDQLAFGSAGTLLQLTFDNGDRIEAGVWEIGPLIRLHPVANSGGAALGTVTGITSGSAALVFTTFQALKDVNFR